MIALVGMADLLAATGENERAIELVAFILDHRASWQETKEQAATVLASASSKLPPEAARAAQAKGRAGEFEITVTKALAES